MPLRALLMSLVHHRRPRPITMTVPDPALLSLAHFFVYQHQLQPLSVTLLTEFATGVVAALVCANQARESPRSPRVGPGFQLRCAALEAPVLEAPKLLQRCMSHAMVHPEDVLGACILLLRLWRRVPDAFACQPDETSELCNAFFLGALILSVKEMAPCDDVFDNKSFAACAKTTVKTVNHLELEFLDALQWQVAVMPTDFEELLQLDTIDYPSPSPIGSPTSSEPGPDHRSSPTPVSSAAADDGHNSSPQAELHRDSLSTASAAPQSPTRSTHRRDHSLTLLASILHRDRGHRSATLPPRPVTPTSAESASVPRVLQRRTSASSSSSSRNATPHLGHSQVHGLTRRAASASSVLAASPQPLCLSAVVCHFSDLL
eukprot:TRINITY_DN3724_c0_g1_i4.p1 TRINITY_DN3724_c0_g1~~TRINITY_DN3724_c0_g1_i4.p1  ORF type:complete len:375 (-),score=51.10 TRINITY_DN3724_c0_g1_i4:1031-2155(-)